MITKIETAGTDVIIAGRRNGGYVIEQGSSHILLTANEAEELVTALAAVLAPRATTPAKARLMRYPITSE